MNLCTSGVTRGLMGASAQMKIAGVSIGIYEKAKSEKNEATMNRAMKYAGEAMTNAEQYSKETDEALTEAKVQAKEEARIEQQEALEKSRRQASDAMQPKKDVAADALATVDENYPVSPDGAAKEAAIKTQPAEGDFAQKTSSETKIYTPKGAVAAVASKPRISVKV